jgi:A/G-specific adenine glycosylase
MSFSKTLLNWNDTTNRRAMPWKGEKNPYYIWLSEVILQQTRVEQGLPYFEKFKKEFPTVQCLANAPEDKVMKLWQGLGYYSRARNLHFTAKYVANELKGTFPPTFDELRKLKGVGDYTAAAIASFAYNEKRAVVDGNVIRVLSRVFCIQTPFDTTAGKKEFAALAQKLIDYKHPGIYNQAIMDFGSLVCTPQKPLCEGCPFQRTCVAYNKDMVAELPVRANRTVIKQRYFNYLLIKSNTEILVQKREGKDIWAGLYQLPLLETEKPLTRNLQKAVAAFLGTTGFTIGERYTETQMLSHRKIHFNFLAVQVNDFKNLQLPQTERIKLGRLSEYGFPRTIHLYLKQNSLL